MFLEDEDEEDDFRLPLDGLFELVLLCMTSSSGEGLRVLDGDGDGLLFV